MRKTVLALSALAAVAITASAVNYTEASPLVNPAGLSGAVDELAMIDNVHCRPGWRHHYSNNWRRADGCRRYSRSGGVYVVPGRTRYVIRDGVRVRVGTGGARTTVRGSDTTVRTRTNVNVRDGGGQRDGGANVNVRGGGTQGTGGATRTQGGGAPKGSGGAQKGGGQGGQGTQN